MKKAVLIVMLTLVILLGTAVAAQALTSNVTVTAAVPNVFSLTLDNATVAFGTVTVEGTDTLTDEVTVSIKSNKLFNFGYTGANFSDGGTNTMGIDVLEHQIAGDATVAWETMATGSHSIANNVGRGKKDFVNSYRISVPLTVEPANYSTTIVYEAVQN